MFYTSKIINNIIEHAIPFRMQHKRSFKKNLKTDLFGTYILISKLNFVIEQTLSIKNVFSYKTENKKRINLSPWREKNKHHCRQNKYGIVYWLGFSSF